MPDTGNQLKHSCKINAAPRRRCCFYRRSVCFNIIDLHSANDSLVYQSDNGSDIYSFFELQAILECFADFSAYLVVSMRIRGKSDGVRYIYFGKTSGKYLRSDCISLIWRGVLIPGYGAHFRLWDLRITQTFSVPSANSEHKRLHYLRRTFGGLSRSRSCVRPFISSLSKYLIWHSTFIVLEVRQSSENYGYCILNADVI